MSITLLNDTSLCNADNGSIESLNENDLKTHRYVIVTNTPIKTKLKNKNYQFRTVVTF